MQNCNKVESDCVCSQISRTFEDNFTRLRFGWKLRKVEVVNWCLLSNQRDKLGGFWELLPFKVSGHNTFQPWRKTFQISTRRGLS